MAQSPKDSARRTSSRALSTWLQYSTHQFVHTWLCDVQLTVGSLRAHLACDKGVRFRDNWKPPVRGQVSTRCICRWSFWTVVSVGESYGCLAQNDSKWATWRSMRTHDLKRARLAVRCMVKAHATTGLPKDGYQLLRGRMKLCGRS